MLGYVSSASLHYGASRLPPSVMPHIPLDSPPTGSNCHQDEASGFTDFGFGQSVLADKVV